MIISEELEENEIEFRNTAGEKSSLSFNTWTFLDPEEETKQRKEKNRGGGECSR